MPINYKNYNPNDLDIDDDSAIQPVGVEPPTPSVIGRPDQNLRKRTDHIKSVFNDHETLASLERGSGWKSDLEAKWYGPASETDLGTDDPTSTQRNIGTVALGADLVLIQPNRPDLKITVPVSALAAFFGASSPASPGGATLQYRRRMPTTSTLAINLSQTNRTGDFTVSDADLLITSLLIVVRSSDLSSQANLAAGMYIKNPVTGRMHIISSVPDSDTVVLSDDNPILPTEDSNAAGTYELYDTDGTTLLRTINSTTVMTQDGAGIVDSSIRLPIFHIDDQGTLFWAFTGARIPAPGTVDGTAYELTRPQSPTNDDRYTPTSQLGTSYISKIADDTTKGAITFDDDTPNAATRTMISVKKSNAGFSIPDNKSLSVGVSAIDNAGSYDPEYTLGLDPTAGGVSDPWITIDVSNNKLVSKKDTNFDQTITVAGNTDLQSTTTVSGLLTADGGIALNGDLVAVGDGHVIKFSTSSGKVSFNRDDASGGQPIVEILSDDGTGINGKVDIKGTLSLGDEVQIGSETLIRNPSGAALLNLATDAKLSIEGPTSAPKHFLSSNTLQRLTAAELACVEHGHTLLSDIKFDFGTVIQSDIGSNPTSVPTSGTIPVPSVDISTWEIFTSLKYRRDYDEKIARIAGFLFWCKLSYVLASLTSGEDFVQTGSIILSLSGSIVVNGKGSFVVAGPKYPVYRKSGLTGNQVIEHYFHGVLWNPLLEQYGTKGPSDPGYPGSIIPTSLYYIFHDEVNDALGSSPKMQNFLVEGELYGVVL